MSTPDIQPGFQQVTRHHTIFQERVDDAYKIKGKRNRPYARNAVRIPERTLTSLHRPLCVQST